MSHELHIEVAVCRVGLLIGCDEVSRMRFAHKFVVMAQLFVKQLDDQLLEPSMTRSLLI